MSISIASSFSICLGVYQDLVAALADSSQPLRDEISLSELEDELGRFKVWAGNIAAHKVGRASLDFRLRDASPLRDRIIGLIQDMENLLREAIPIVIGERVPRDATASDTDSSDDALSDDQGDLPEQPEHKSTTELQQTFLDIVDIIDCLYKLSITIRNPSAHDRLIKAASVDTGFYEYWDIQHVKNKFPGAKEYLAVRLGTAASKRRQYLQYREKHRKKLGQDVTPTLRSAPGKQPLKPDAQAPPSIFVPSSDLNDHVGNLRQSDEAPSIVATTILTQTTASEFFGGNVEFEVESDSGQTQTSYATSVGNEGSLSIPPLPKEAQGGRLFECQYCFTIVSIKNTRSWRKHVLRDLQPYVCTFESCRKGSKLFESRNEWFDHELQAHRKEWYCGAGCDDTFTLRSDFEKHMSKGHPNTFSDHQLAALLDICQRPVEENSEGQCPLCAETLRSMKQLCRHLARHLEALAIFALPRNKDEDKEEEGFGSDKAQLSDASRGLSDGTLSFSSKSWSGSEGSHLDVDVDRYDEISAFLDDFKDSDRLPPSFTQPFQQQFRHFLDTGPDSTTLQVFKDVREVVLGPSFELLMESGSNVRDVVSLFYQTTKFLEKPQERHPLPPGIAERDRPTIVDERSIGGGTPDHGVLDKAAAVFVDLMASTLNSTGNAIKNPGLVLRLGGLRSNLMARSGRMQMLRETRQVEEPEKHETYGLLNPDWAKCWGIDVQELRLVVMDREVTRQQNIHSVWTSERTYLEGLEALMTLYQDDLIDDPSITEDGKRFDFIEKVFNKADAVRKAHSRLLASLRTRLDKEGPFVDGISGIFRNWLQPEVKEAYFDYARVFPASELLIQRAIKGSPQLKRAIEGESARIDWLKYLRSPMGRVQQCIRLLIAVQSETNRDTEDSRHLQLDIDEMKSFYSVFESHIQSGVAKASRIELAGKLVLRQETENIDLDLEDEARQLFYKGDLIRRSTNGTVLINFACLFDNYFVLSAPTQRANPTNSAESEMIYEVRKMPIPMSLLMLEERKEAPILTPESMATKGLHASQLFPFHIHQLGKLKSYTLYTKSRESRDTWREQIIAAIEAHASTGNWASNSPFSLHVLVDTALQPHANAQTSNFVGLKRSALDALQGVTSPQTPSFVRIRGSALDKALQELGSDSQPTPLPADVTCATTFRVLGLELVAIGTEEGFTICKTQNRRGWNEFIKLSSVKQIFVIEEFNIFVILASGSLWAYRTETLWGFFNEGVADGSSRSKPPPITEIVKNVSFFVVGCLKDRFLLICAKKDGLCFAFEVLEPMRHEPTKKTLFSFRSPKPEMSEIFRKYDEFFIPTPCFGINIFNKYLAVSTLRSFEVLTLDKRRPVSVPDLTSPHVAAIAARLRLQRPRAMLRLPAEEFFCCYEETGVYIDKHGDLSRSTVIEFVGRAKKVATVDKYILLFNDDFVEIRDIWNGNLRQVIAGQNIRCLNDAQGDFNERNVVMAMAHPELDDRQLVLEFRLKRTEESEA